ASEADGARVGSGGDQAAGTELASDADAAADPATRAGLPGRRRPRRAGGGLSAGVAAPVERERAGAGGVGRCGGRGGGAGGGAGGGGVRAGDETGAAASSRDRGAGAGADRAGPQRAVRPGPVGSGTGRAGRPVPAGGVRVMTAPAPQACWVALAPRDTML